jgi:hypothetical protein
MDDYTPNFVSTRDQMPDDGDTVSASCKSCVETYSYVVGEGDSSRCPDCAEEFNNLDRVGGSMRVRDEEERQKIASNIEDGEYGVFIDERVGDIWVCRE